MSGTSEPADTQRSGNGAEPQDDVRARFREALERKQAKAKSREGHADGSSKIHDAHGPASSRRVFRRKSG
ncbi:MAG TPA: DUF5302 domain-containing protein [Actinophytocola sp.]|nr:DUF5302 domain-containing protein [Actinophytocola sp.]HEV2784409.1 DUF5302 domain-containing protein [Actinophytocola sp.]